MPFQIPPAEDLPHESTTNQRTLYTSPFITLRVDDVTLPSGRASDRHVVERNPSVVIVPLTEDNHVLMVRQYRYATGHRLLELPAGMIDPGETPLQTAARELREETAHQASALEELATLYLSPGFTDEQSTFVLATGCTPIPTQQDPDEPVQLIRVPLADVPSLLQPGSAVIQQAQATIGLLWLLNLSTNR